MGFRTGAYCTIWEVTPKRDTITNARISISRKNKQTDEYEQDFGGYVSFMGTASAQKAAGLKRGDRIKLGDVDVTRRYDSVSKVEYTNFNIYSFEIENEGGMGTQGFTPHESSYSGDSFLTEGLNGFDGSPEEARLPF